MAGPNFYKQGRASQPINQQLDRHDIGSAALSTCPSCGHSGPANHFTKNTRNPLNPTGYEANG